MSIRDLLLPELDQEMANTRNLLQRVPMDRPDWKPHNKSMTMGRLAGHVAELPNWAARIVETEVLDLTPMVTEGHHGYSAKSSQELLQTFDKNVAEARNVLAKASDENLSEVWSMTLKGKTVLSGPRFPMIRSIFLNHLIHHRAQLGVYMRLNDVPLPAMYGPSADEGQTFSQEQ
ncbi:MAG: hypothetical protein H6Q07_2292 [Acidobacteria bacterium]|nr:hypothetical protein [Acidobacteriota bacterium]